MHDSVVIVTGGSSGIGRGIALEFADAGASVAIGDVREAPKETRHWESDDTPTHEAIRDDGGEALFVETDVSDPEACRRLVEETLEQFGRLDALVNNAGVHSRDYPEDAESLDVEEWQRILDINLSGQFYCAKHALPALKETAGTIVNIASVQGTVAAHCPAYAASNAGIINLTRDLATAYGADGVTVNAICPGPVKTSNWNYQSAAAVEEALAEVRRGEGHTVLTRFGLPADIGKAAVFLASDDAEWVTGEAFTVDGGYSAHLP